LADLAVTPSEWIVGQVWIAQCLPAYVPPIDD
jgi:hypothetical protein